MFSKNITELRKTKQMTQADVAKILHVSTSAVGMYEQGRRAPSIDIIVNYAKLFSVTTDYLLIDN